MDAAVRRRTRAGAIARATLDARRASRAPDARRGAARVALPIDPPRPLRWADAARLRLETAATPMTITVLLFFDRPVSIERLRARVRERLLTRRRFRMAVRDRGVRGAAWVPVGAIDLAAHVAAIVAPPGRSIADVAGALATAPLPLDRPRWSMHLVTEERARDPAAVLVVRVHHCVGDAAALLAVLRDLADDAPGDEGAARAARRRRARAAWPGSSPWRALAGAAELFAPMEPRPRLLDGALRGTKRIAWTREVPLSALRDAAHARGATIGELLVAVTAAGIRRWMRARGAPVDDACVSALVPVSFGAADADGNHYGSVVVPLPVGVAPADARLWAARVALEARRRSGAARVASWLIGASARVAPSVARFVAAHARGPSLAISDVTGPDGAVAIAGARVRRVVVSVPALGAMPLTVGFFSYAGAIGGGITTDAAALPDAAAIADAISAELDEACARDVTRGAGAAPIRP